MWNQTNLEIVLSIFLVFECFSDFKVFVHDSLEIVPMIPCRHLRSTAVTKKLKKTIGRTKVMYTTTQEKHKGWGDSLIKK